MTTNQTQAATQWYALDPDAALAALTTNVDTGLSSREASSRLETYGANVIASEPSPTWWAIALGQFRDPMQIMLLAVTVVSFAIGQTPVGLLVGALLLLNIILSTRQELLAQASVNALATMQIPQARVVRDGTLLQIPATELVPGDIVQLEAGDLVPADGRLVTSATLETQEASLTGESAPIAKDPSTLASGEVALGDRSNMAFQNTLVTRGTATIVVTDTGMRTQMGLIASMLSAVKPSKSPLRRELDSLTKVLGAIAWGAVAIIVILGIARGQSVTAVLLLGISMAISAIPTGLPTFVQAMLAHGARQLAESKAVVKNLNDVETLGATSAINSDKTGTLTMNQMTVQSLYFRGQWFTVHGEGYSKTGEILHVAGAPLPEFTRLGYELALNSDATVSDDGVVVGDPTEAALVVLAAKLGVDAEQTRRAYPREAVVPFDSAYKFMATFHHLPLDGETRFIELVKGGPDVVLQRCTSAAVDDQVVPIAEVQDELLAANRSMSEQGLRVLAFAIRFVDGREDEVSQEPMSFTEDLAFIGMVGIIDPLRAEALDAVNTAKTAGIEVRMITGDHAITASAIGAKLGLGPGAISGAELQAMSDQEVIDALPNLHVFGRVTPQDKLRLAKLMQSTGDVVAMTGDAVNDAAALKQADIGVAMGSGSEVTKQAGKMILTDDNFGTLIKAIRIGRGIYDKIVSYIRFQMSSLLSLVILFLVASIFNINGGVVLTPLMILFINFFITTFPVAVIILGETPADIMKQRPRDPKVTVSNSHAVWQWIFYGVVQFAVTLAALLLAPGGVSSTEPNIPMTMAFVVMSLSTIFAGLTMRRDPGSGLDAPIIGALKLLAIPTIIVIASVETNVMRHILTTTSLTGGQWLVCLGWALVLPIVVEGDKWVRRMRTARTTQAEAISVADAVGPARAR